MNKIAQYRLLEKAAVLAGKEIGWVDPTNIKEMRKLKKKINIMGDLISGKLSGKMKRRIFFHNKVVPMAVGSALVGMGIITSKILDKTEKNKNEQTSSI